LELPHRNLLLISSFKGALAVFLDECRKRRADMWAHHLRTARVTDGKSPDELQARLDDLEHDIGYARSELAEWQVYVSHLEDTVSHLRTAVKQRSREESHIVAQGILNDCYTSASKLHKQRFDAMRLICKASKTFLSRQQLTSIRQAHDAVVSAVCIQRACGVLTARLRLLAAKRREKLGETLCTAALKGLAPVVSKSLEKGACVNWAMQDGTTSLYVAASEGHDAIVRLLCEAGANTDQAKNDGVTPLHISSCHGHFAVVRSLCEAGAHKGLLELALRLEPLQGHDAIAQFLSQTCASMFRLVEQENSSLKTRSLRCLLGEFAHKAVRQGFQIEAQSNALNEGGTAVPGNMRMDRGLTRIEIQTRTISLTIPLAAVHSVKKGSSAGATANVDQATDRDSLALMIIPDNGADVELFFDSIVMRDNVYTCWRMFHMNVSQLPDGQSFTSHIVG